MGARRPKLNEWRSYTEAMRKIFIPFQSSLATLARTSYISSMEQSNVFHIIKSYEMVLKIDITSYNKNKQLNNFGLFRSFAGEMF